MRVPYISVTHLLYIALGACLHYAWLRLRARRPARHTYTVRRHLESSQDSVVLGTADTLDQCAVLIKRIIISMRDRERWSSSVFTALRDDGVVYEWDGEVWQLHESVAKTCWPKYHGVTDSRYCGLHGWEAGWPCSKAVS